MSLQSPQETEDKTCELRERRWLKRRGIQKEKGAGKAGGEEVAQSRRGRRAQSRGGGLRTWVQAKGRKIIWEAEQM